MYTEYSNEMRNIIADTVPAALKKSRMLKMDQGILKAGTVLGKITASKNCMPCDKTSSDGSEVAESILYEDVDTDGASDVKAIVYVSGHFQNEALIFGGASVVADHEDQLRDVNIYVK